MCIREYPRAFVLFVIAHARSVCRLRPLSTSRYWTSVRPSPVTDRSRSHSAHVWKITLSSSRYNSCLGKNVLAFYKRSLCSAVRSTLRAGRRICPTYQGVQGCLGTVCVEYYRQNESGEYRTRCLQICVVRWIHINSPKNSSKALRSVNITQSHVVGLTRLWGLKDEPQNH